MIAKRAVAIVLALLAIAVGYRAISRNVHSAAPEWPGVARSTTQTKENEPTTEATQGFLYGRMTTLDGATYQGRLRWGGVQEAFWDDYFNGVKQENAWIALVPPEVLSVRHPVEIFGVRIGVWETQRDVGRQFTARFGEIARIEALGDRIRTTLKGGTVFDLARFDASDFDDGVRVWDDERGTIDVDSLRIRTIELLSTPGFDAAPDRLRGTVRTKHGDFTGFIQWERDQSVGSDELDGRDADGEARRRFDTIRSIARGSRGGLQVTLRDGRTIELAGRGEAGDGNRGIYVHDQRFGRVQVSWDAFEAVEFDPGGSGPAYDDFAPGLPLAGSVTTSDGRRLSGRLVYDLNESETSETLDAPFQDLDYFISFGSIASIVVPAGEGRGKQLASVTLHNGEVLRLEHAGDLGDENAGMLVFVDGQRPEYVSWAEVERVDFDSAG
jgi:hypothetical protein